MKSILLEIISSDTSYNKSATRYLYKTHPNLWMEILTITSFLNNDPLPKQRIWHILNDIWEVPKCPITGVNLTWCEKQYFGTANRRAKQLLKHKNGDYKNSHTIESNLKRKQSNIETVKTGRKYRSKETYTEAQKENQRQTFLKNYGVDNPSKHASIRKKLSDVQIKNGATPKHLRSLKRLYYDRVRYFTKLSWKEDFDKINPTRLNRSKIDLDHIYSIHQGFIDNIPPYIIGHWTNLRMLNKPENYSKGKRCDKTRDRLFEDFFSTWITG